MDNSQNLPCNNALQHCTVYINRYNKKAKPGKPRLQFTRFPGRLRERILHLQSSMTTARSWFYRAWLLECWQKLRHQLEISKTEIEAFPM